MLELDIQANREHTWSDITIFLIATEVLLRAQSLTLGQNKEVLKAGRNAYTLEVNLTYQFLGQLIAQREVLQSQVVRAGQEA